MLTSIRFLLLVPLAALAAAAPRFEIREQRGRYQLNFDATYVTYVNTDVETAISFPEGYLITATMPGSRDYVSVGALQNTVYISKAVDHAITTNLILHVRTPEGTDKKLVFELRGVEKSPNVYAIEFEKPNTSDINRTVESMKSVYQGELAAKLSEQEKKLTETVTETTLKRSLPLFFNCHRGDISQEYKGATVYLEGIITHEQSSYVYLRTDIRREDCSVVRLLKVESGKDYSSIPELISTQENSDGTVTIVYRVIAIPSNSNKTVKYKFNVEIWSKTFTLTQKIS